MDQKGKITNGKNDSLMNCYQLFSDADVRIMAGQLRARHLDRMDGEAAEY
jgi:hypothetical protein